VHQSSLVLRDPGKLTTPASTQYFGAVPHTTPVSLDRLAPALAGRYTLERELGRGGMATVYLADDLKHHRRVAIKVLRPELGALLGPDRFAREIRIAAGLNHPHILPLYDSGEAVVGRKSEVVTDSPATYDPRPVTFLYYVMPFVAGDSLRRRLAREGQLPIDEALRIVRQVAAALHHAHGQGVIHRDIKPENVLLHEGEAMVADFGIALAADAAGGERLTETGLMVGTPEYMSPEQAAGERALDARSDVYSLGCVLYELLAGEPPHQGATARMVIARRFTEPAPRVRRRRPAVPQAVEQALVRALAREPGERFATAAAFADALTAPAASAGAGEGRTPSVAILPFQSLSADPENEFFADGITEDVIAQLSKIRSLKVISRGSVMGFKKRDRDLREIGTALDVETLLEGSVRRAGDRVRIVAQLVDAATERHVWAETYDRRLTDIFAIQTDVALQIAAALKAELSLGERTRIHREPTADVHAYQLYLQGRHCYTRYTEESIRKGIAYFGEAVAADPGYAMAHVGAALAYAELAAGQGGGMVRPDYAYHQGIEAVSTALRLDPDLGEAHAVLGLLRMVHDFDWAGAEAEFKLALELSPGAADVYDHYGWLCGAVERYDEALALVQRAQELDPLTHRADVAATLLRAGRNEEALQAALRAIEFDPEYGRARSTLGWAYLKLGMTDQGVAELEYAVRLAPGHSLYLGQLGEAYGLVGKTEQAREVLRQLEETARERYVSPYHLAYVYTGLGEHEAAVACLERAYEERAGGVYGIKGSFLFTPLRGEPGFRRLLEKMNLA
jgi:serine/threonine protein kinase/tetratricopeptide (TPR) repeat protein